MIFECGIDDQTSHHNLRIPQEQTLLLRYFIA